MSSSNRAAQAAGIFGLLAVLVIPAGIAASRYTGGVTLLESLYYTVPAAFVLALIALSANRRARFARARSVQPEGGRLSGFLAWAGLYVALIGAVALAVYGALRTAQ
jgi:hypothetical protein